MRKPTICMGENKDADQLRGNREADQRLCFRYTDSTFPPLLIPKFSRFWVSSVTVQAGLCWTWSETQIVGFVMHRLNLDHNGKKLQFSHIYKVLGFFPALFPVVTLVNIKRYKKPVIKSSQIKSNNLLDRIVAIYNTVHITYM